MLLLDNSNILHLLSSGRRYFRRGSICLYQGVALNQQLSLSCIRSASSCPDFRSADSFNYIHADMGISVPVSAFFVFDKHNSAADFSID